MPARRAAPPIGLVVLAVVALSELRRDEPSEPGAAGSARVVRVVDGDTIRVRQGSEEIAVRYIGVDTPETAGSPRGDECFAASATALNRDLVSGRSVRLVLDAEHRDRYGRLLAYVYREPDGLFVNAELVRRGHARPLAIAPNTRFADRFEALARAARGARRGLWGEC